MSATDEPPDSEQPLYSGPSRSQKKRDAHAVADLGLLLTKLSRAELLRLPLEEDLREAILYCQQLRKGAYARQLRYIAKQLKEFDLSELRKSLELSGRLK